MYWQDATETLLKPLVTAKRLGVVADLDGTLSHVVPLPDMARVTPINMEMLIQLAEKLPLVSILSGRLATDIRHRVGLEKLIYVGNHGMDRWHGTESILLPEAAAYRPAIQTVTRALEPHLLKGMWLEEKGASLAIHYRGAGDADMTEIQKRVEALAKEHNLNLLYGRKLYELRAPISINKGSTLEILTEEYQLDALVFMGDDITDTDGFIRARQLRESGRCYAIGLGVEADETPQIVYDTCDVVAQGVVGIEAFLTWLNQSI